MPLVYRNLAREVPFDTGKCFGGGPDLNNSHDDDLRVTHIEELRSRIDESLTSLDQDKGTGGDKFMQRMLSDLDSLNAKPDSVC